MVAQKPEEVVRRSLVHGQVGHTLDRRGGHLARPQLDAAARAAEDVPRVGPVAVAVAGEHGRLVVENQSAGGRTVVTRAALTQAWREGALRFVLHGGGRVEERARTQAAQTTDLHTLPEGVVGSC